MAVRLQHPWWVYLAATWAAAWAGAATAEPGLPHEGNVVEQAALVEVVLEDGEAVEVNRMFSMPDQVEEPELFVYVPATRAAKSCVFKLLNSILSADDELLPLNVVTVLDLSHVNGLLGGFVRRIYKADREDNPNERVRFWIDEGGQTQSWWNIDRAVCAYTLYHPHRAPLSGSGMPSRRFLYKFLRSLARD